MCQECATKIVLAQKVVVTFDKFSDPMYIGFVRFSEVKTLVKTGSYCSGL